MRHTLLLIAVLFATQIFAQTNRKEHLDIVLSKPGKPYKLNVDLKTGTIKVSADTGNIVRIDAEIEETPYKKEDRQNQNTNTNTHINSNINNHESKSRNVVTKIAGKYLSGQEHDNTISLSQVLPGKRLNVVIWIPVASTRLSLSVTGKGDIVVTGVNGELEISCADGSIQLQNISGSAVANTVNGNITATFKDIDQKAAMAFSTLVGNIDLTLVTGIAANFKLKSDRGELYTDFKMQADKNHPNAKPNLQAIKSPTNKQAGFRILNNDWVYGNLDGDGPEIMLANMEGNIYIRKAR